MEFERRLASSLEVGYWSGSESNGGNDHYDNQLALSCVLPANLNTAHPSADNTCGQPGNSCYDNQEAMNRGESQLPDGNRIVLTQAAGEFKVWRDRNADRILNASGLVSHGWQKKLSRAGTSFTETDFSDVSQIAGRVCPLSVFLNHDKMTETGRCLYYDIGNAVQQLDDASKGGTEGSDWLGEVDRAATGRGTKSSYFEGNIKTCADKGMRLPTMYESSASNNPYFLLGGVPYSYKPDGDLVTKGGSLSDHPAFAGAKGVPSYGAWTWTDTNYNSTFYTNRASVRCVLP